MSWSEFRKVANQMHALHEQEAYSEAYELVTREAARYPKYASRLTFWRACLATRMGQPELALDLLEQGLAAGLWYWTTSLREDPDLEPLQGLPRFERAVDMSAERQASARQKSAPELVILEPEGLSGERPVRRPLLIALHGHRNTAKGTAARWRGAVSKGWYVALPQSGQEEAPGEYVWLDREWMEAEVHHHYRRVLDKYPVDRDQLVLGGFSMGGRWAIWLAASGSLDALGFVVVAPYIPDLLRLTPLFERPRSHALRGSIIVGAKDEACSESARALAQLMNSRGLACQIQVHEDLGHAYPPDFATSLVHALEFVAHG